MTEKKYRFWDMFTMVENGKLKSTFMMYSFALSFVFLAAYAFAFILLVEPLHGLFSPMAPWLAGIMECLIPALAGSIFCVGCQKIARNKRLASAAFLWLALYGAATLVITLTSFERSDWGLLLSLLVQVIPLPLLIGGGWTFLIAKKHERH